jgi:hypothetical protein
MSRLISLLAIFITLATALPVEAARFSITPTVVAVYDSAYDPIVPAPIGSLGTHVFNYSGQVHVYQVQFLLSVSDLTGNEDSFGFASFDINLGARLSEIGTGWVRNDPPIDMNGNLPGGTGNNMFAVNGDTGLSNNDEKEMLIQMAAGPFSHAVDPRHAVGEVGSTYPVPFNLGSLFVTWSANRYSTLTLSNVQFGVKLTDGAFVGNQKGTVGRVVFGFPEPGTLAMAGMGVFALVLRRRNG